MKAITQDAYGSASVLRLRDVDKPSPGTGEVLRRALTPRGTLVLVGNDRYDRTYPLAGAAEAIAHIAGGHAAGKGIITI